MIYIMLFEEFMNSSLWPKSEQPIKLMNDMMQITFMNKPIYKNCQLGNTRSRRTYTLFQLMAFVIPSSIC